MKNLNMSIVIDPQFSADEWGLYDVSERNGVAKILNDALRSVVNDGKHTRFMVETHMLKIMRAHATFGAYDSFVTMFLTDILNEIYYE